VNRRRVLILSGSIGQGHAAVAQACAEAFRNAGHDPVIRDCMELLGPIRRRVAHAVFRGLLGVPPLYDALHFSGLRAGAPFAVRSAGRATVHLVRALRPELEHPSLEAVLAVFALGAGVVGWAAQRRKELKGVVVVSDATAHRVWVQPGVKRYVVFSQLAAGSVLQYDPGAEVVVVDPPVRTQFFDPPERLAARQTLGWPESETIALVMGGGWARGPLLQIAARLAARDLFPVVLAGANRRLLHHVATGPDGHRPMLVLGPRDDVHLLMAASDVVVTSPGQACHEARVVGRPLVVMDSVPGHGRENLLGELAQGGMLAAAANPRAVEEAVLAVLQGARHSPAAVPRGPWARQLLEAVEGTG
jgi:processive 1,2-diacylglycerol beta-glucosyltransferase